VLTTHPHFRTLLTLAALMAAAGPAGAQVVGVVDAFDTETPPIVRESGVDEQLGEAVPLDIALRDQQGRAIRFGDLLRDDRPIALVFAYHSCPMLCSLVLDGFAQALKETGLEPGRDFTPVTVSFDPRDTPDRSAEARDRYVRQAGRAGLEASWPFLTGDPDETRRLAEAVGFEYQRDARTGEYAHPAVMVFITPEGRVARYLYGASFDRRDFRFAVMEAGQGRVGSTLDRFVLSCYRYDPDHRSYTPAAVGALRVGGGIFLVCLVGLLVPLWRRERRRQSPTPNEPGPTA
jgi:protein SCO1/2